MVLQAVGARIRELRRARGLTLAQLAKRANTHASHLGAIERATRNPTLGMLAQIANALKVDLPTLLDLRANATKRTLAAEVRKRANELDEIRLRRVLGILDVVE